MARSVTARAANYLFRELIGSILYFPVWWYTTGVVVAWRRLLRQWHSAVDRLGLRYLLINMGRPMYGDYTRSGKIISFFFRLLLVGWSGLLLGLWAVVIVAIFFLWLLAPAVSLGLLLRQLIPGNIYG